MHAMYTMPCKPCLPPIHAMHTPIRVLGTKGRGLKMMPCPGHPDLPWDLEVQGLASTHHYDLALSCCDHKHTWVMVRGDADKGCSCR